MYNSVTFSPTRPIYLNFPFFDLLGLIGGGLIMYALITIGWGLVFRKGKVRSALRKSILFFVYALAVLALPYFMQHLLNFIMSGPQFFCLSVDSKEQFYLLYPSRQGDQMYYEDNCVNFKQKAFISVYLWGCLELSLLTILFYLHKGVLFKPDNAPKVPRSN